MIVTIFSVIFPSIFVYYYNYNSSFYASKKIVRLKLDGSEMIKINKIRQDFSNTIQNNDINPKYYLTSDVFETKKLIKLFSDHLKLFSDHLKDNTISGEESKINPFKEQLSDLDFEIIFPDIDVDGTDIKIYSDKEIDFKSIINNMIE